MAISANYLESIYTGKNNALSAYQINKLEITKPCLVRFNKYSPNGISFTIADIVDAPFSSKVSKNALENGTKPVEFKIDDTLIFAINAQMKKDNKPTDEAGAITSIAELLKAKGVQEGEIFFMKCDFGMVPGKGMDKDMFEFMSQKKDSSLMQIHKFDGTGQFTEVCESLDLNPEKWSPVLEALTGVEFKEMGGGYQKRSFSDLLNERVTYLKALTPAQKVEIVQSIGYGELSAEDLGSIWVDIATRLLTNV